jgi:hypothetical protein|tara:strand:+ start:4282 stop:4434 length:153 start_codon:yes stop_codon:yes gene_type:complete
MPAKKDKEVEKKDVNPDTEVTGKVRIDFSGGIYRTIPELAKIKKLINKKK